jgi:hypothetical protein
MSPDLAMPTPEQKISILEDTLRCFVLGLCSLIPILGAGFAIAAGRAWARVHRADPGRWNPTRRYLRWGIGLASVGALLAVGLVAIIALAVWDEMY